MLQQNLASKLSTGSLHTQYLLVIMFQRQQRQQVSSIISVYGLVARRMSLLVAGLERVLKRPYPLKQRFLQVWVIVRCTQQDVGLHKRYFPERNQLVGSAAFTAQRWKLGSEECSKFVCQRQFPDQSQQKLIENVLKVLHFCSFQKLCHR